MAAPAYTEDLTDITLAETTTDWNAYGGGSSGLSASPDLSMQGTNCVDKQITNADKGMLYDSTTAITLGSGDHIFVWIFCGTPGLTDSIQNNGTSVGIGTGTAAFCKYHVEGNDTYGAAGRTGKCYVVDYTNRTTNATPPYRTATGTPGASPSFFGGGLNTTATVKGANLGVDAIRYGTGAYLTAGELISAGDASDNPCTFDGFATQNDNVSNRWGILTNLGGSYELQGTFAIGQNNAGTATLCRFEDSDRNISLVDTFHSASNFTQILIDHASTVCNWTNINITALGTNNPGLIAVQSNNPEFNVTGGTLTNIGTTVLRSNSTMTGVTWRGTDQITQNGATLDGCIIDQNSATAALLSDNPSLTDDCTFISDGTGHAIEITSSGIYSLTGHSYSGYAGSNGSTGNEVIYNNSGGSVTLNVSGGDTPTVRDGAGASTTVNATVTFSLSNVVSGTTLYVEATSGGSLTAGDVMVAATTVTVDPYTANLTANQPFKCVLANASGATKYVPIIFEDTTGSGFSRRIEQQEDGN